MVHISKNMIVPVMALCCLFPTVAFSVHETGAVASSQDEKYSLLLPVIEGQLKAIREGNIDKAYQEYTSADFRKVTSLEQFKELISQYAVLAKNKTFQFQSLYFEEHIGTFQGALVSTDGDALQTEYDLVEEQGKWKIEGIQLFKPEAAMLRQGQ